MMMNALSVIKRNPVVLALAILATVAMMFINEGSYRQSVGALDELDTIGKARTGIKDLQRSILAAEAGQRGFLLTGRKEYLSDFDRAHRETTKALAALEQSLGKATPSADALPKLQALTQAKLAALTLAIRLHDEGQQAASTDIVLSDLNLMQMDAIRTIGTELLQAQEQRAKSAHDELDTTLLIRRISVALLSAISLLALLLYLRHNAVVDSHRLELMHSAHAESDRLEAEVKQRTAQLAELTLHLQTAREDERNRLARNLHDELGALLTSAKLDAARIKSRLASNAPEAQERLAHLVETLNASIALGRSIIEDLRPSTLANLGLVPTLEILLREFAVHSGVKVHAELHAVQLDHATELVVYRMVQEAITNLSKYARASQVWVSLGPRDGRVEVSVRDDGVGFDTNTPPRSAFGLAGMRFRVEAAGGSMTLVAAPEQGTQIQVSLPQSA